MSGATDFRIDGPLPDRRLALEASAGTGKTYALTALAVRSVAETGIALHELLMVTFTRMATAELRERVRRGLGDAAREIDAALADPDGWARRMEEGDPDPVIATVVGGALGRPGELERRRGNLRRAAHDLDEATISTIHGFCQRMLQHAALEAGVDFDAVLLDDDAELRDEIVDDWTALRLRGADPAWIRYLRGAGIGRKRLQDLARTVTGLPALALRPEIPDAGAPPAETWAGAVGELRAAWEGDGPAEMERLIARLKEDGALRSGQRTYTSAKVAEQATKMDEWLAGALPYPDRPVTRPVAGDRPTTHPLRYFSASGLALFLDDGRPPSQPLLDAAERAMRESCDLATAFLQRTARYVWEELTQRKRQRTLLTYDDLLRRLADALSDDRTAEAVRRAIRQRYKAALIDEFQDTDPIQWRIFEAVFGRDDSLALIGDPKQAIYAFRGADVRTYVHARGTAARRETLRTNHRSDEGHVEAVNTLFADDGAFVEPGIDYQRLETRHGTRLHQPAEGHAPLRIRYVRQEAGPVWKGALQKGWADRALPEDVAATAVSLLESGAAVGEGASRRRLEPRDIAVLVRKNARASRVQDALRAAGVPAVIQRGGSVYDTREAEWLQRLLDALLRPGADRAATAAAAAPLFGRDAPTLAAQREAADRAAEWASADGEAPDDDPGQWEAWLDRLHGWGATWHHQGIIAAIREAFDDEGVPQRLLSQGGGDRSLTNLWHLAELLHKAEATEAMGPTALADWLRERRQEAVDRDQPDAETELRLEEDAEAVRIVTIHGSKGLQYPIVLCPDLWDGHAPDDADIRFHDPDAADPAGAITLDVDVDAGSPSRQESRAAARREQFAEHLRVAYVALTRAEHAGVVWWGKLADAHCSPLASLLHARGTGQRADHRLETARARVTDASDDELAEDVRALAAASGGTISVEELASLPAARPWRRERPPAPSLEARRFTRGDVDRAWGRSSFTSLVRPASDRHGRAEQELDPREGRDIDAASAAGDTSPAGHADAPEPTAPDVPLAAFPAGPEPGVFLHDILEHLDFADHDPEAMGRVVAEQERRHGIAREHRESVIDGLRAALATPLGPVARGVRLRDLPRGRRLDELRFELPLAGGHAPSDGVVTLGAIADLLADSGDPLVARYAPALRDPALSATARGFLTGAIDLVAGLPDGRFLVADYKSNRLRDPDTGRCTAWHYRPAALEAEMLGHHYVLQALLYLVAAHRYLRWRMGGAYRYDTHVAGAAYLFLRGMTGPPTALGDHPGESAGVIALQPEAELVERLSALLDHPGGPR